MSIALTDSRTALPSWSLFASIVRRWRTLRYHIGEMRTFDRHLRRLRLAPADAPGTTVILFGIPYSDWNEMLADADLWRGLKGVREVRRVPAFGFLLPRDAGRAIVIPMKTEHAASVPDGCRGLLPSARALQVLGDKRRFAAYVAQNGLSAECPASYASPEEAAFPCVVKRLDLSGSMGVEVAYSHAQLESVLRSRLFAGKPFTLQAAVQGTVEYAATCICDGGQLLWHWTFASTMTGPLVVKSEDNDKNRHTVDMPPGVQAQIERLLVPLDYRGPCVVNYKLTADGTARIFEINPRFGGSLLQRPQADLLRAALGHLLAAVR